MTNRTLTVTMTEIEGHHLLGIVDEYIALLDGPRDAGDSALDRLAPDPYPDDAEAADEYRRGTREDLFDQRLADALSVRTALEGFETMTGAEAAAPHPVRLSVPEVDPWLRTLSAIRLVLASRLGIERTDSHDPQDPRYGTYDWLGYRLELLVQQADLLDG